MTQDLQPSTPDDAGVYAAHRKIYPRSITGPFRRLKTLAMVVLLGIFWGGPWLRWDRGPGVPDQAIFLDLPGRRAYLFNLELWPQEVYYLTALLVFAALLLFFATALAGRVWCGFACFQTVFTDLFVMLERKIEGERPARIALDKAPWTLKKLGRKGLKTFVWALISAGVGVGFTLYFLPDPAAAWISVLSGQAGLLPYTSIAVVGGFCFLLAGYAREQVCIYMCPYGRFQGAMTDEHSRVVTYLAARGEPRAPYRKNADFSQRGHCVDCGLCVQVCPTGVDIRAGQQLACIRLCLVRGCLCPDHAPLRPARGPDRLRLPGADRGPRGRAARAPGLAAAATPDLCLGSRGPGDGARLELGDARPLGSHGIARTQPVVRDPGRWLDPQRLHPQDPEHGPPGRTLSSGSGRPAGSAARNPRPPPAGPGTS